MDTDVAGTLYTDETLDAGDDSRASRIEMPGDLDTIASRSKRACATSSTCAARASNPLADPFLTVLDGEGQRVTSDDDGGDGLDARLRFTPAEPGDYYIQASGLGGSTGGVSDIDRASVGRTPGDACGRRRRTRAPPLFICGEGGVEGERSPGAARRAFAVA